MVVTKYFGKNPVSGAPRSGFLWRCDRLFGKRAIEFERNVRSGNKDRELNNLQF
ncbi:hypothetical protein QUB10_09595 [Microcoleus sp. B5-D4]|uniref:hypothetical protein n=1 Tax=unclassified Microcoleus TaxID=2642155 RepID=UPI002FD77E03